MFRKALKILFKFSLFIVQAKVDHLQKNVNEIMVKLDAILKNVGGEFQLRVSRVFQVMPSRKTFFR